MSWTAPCQRPARRAHSSVIVQADTLYIYAFADYTETRTSAAVSDAGDAGAYAVAVVRVVAGGAAAGGVLGRLEVGEGAAGAASA